MRTLDEVIRALENCCGSNADCCDDCLYTVVNAEGVTICAKCDLEDDALHYLCEHRACLKQLEAVEQIRQDAVRQRDAHMKALTELKTGGWISMKKQIPEAEGQYLTFCKYRNGSTDVKVKLWKNYSFTSENVNVFYWRELPPDPEVPDEK